MAEYIERQAAIDLFYPVDPENDGSDGCTVVYKTENYTSDEIEAVISGLPAADVAPVRHGRWEKAVESKLDTHTGEYWEEEYYNCLKCDYASDRKSPYCPNCGAKMDADG